MSVGVELLKDHRYEELWQRYCGFVDLSMDEVMAIQESLLLEQIGLLKKSPMGQRIMEGTAPKTIEEFRASVPLTSYTDYADDLLAQRESVLPAEPVLWQRTSGASGEYPFKWAPITQRMYEEMGPTVYSTLIFSTAHKRGDINFGIDEKLLYALAPPPYATGCWGRRAAQELPISFLPDLQQAEEMEFDERVVAGLRQGFSEGIDLLFGLPSVLAAIGEKMGERKMSLKELLPLFKKPRTLARLVKGVVKSKLARRPLMPKDLWDLHGIAVAGTDASIYRDKIKELWGVEPLDVYGCTEGLIIAMQTWEHGSMSFLPNLNFFEFIPEDEVEKSKKSPDYHPKTVLMSEVEQGQNYEIVITNFHGGPFVRYRLGDMITITSPIGDVEGSNVPRMEFYSRCDGIIDLAGFARITERTIGAAINATGIACVEWAARKEAKDTPVLHIYIEPRGNTDRNAYEIGAAIHRQLALLDQPYADMESFLGLRPIEVTILSEGAFDRFTATRKAQQADLAHLKPPHLNPSDAIVADLLGEPIKAEEPLPTQG